MDVGVLVLLATLAVAPAEPSAGLTEQVFLDAAMGDARVRAILDEPLAVARADHSRAKTLTNPEITFDRETLRDGPRQDTWSVSWAPPIDLRHRTQGRAGQAQLAAAESRHAVSQVMLRTDLRRSFADWVMTRHGAAFSQRLADVVDRLARQAEAQASRGEASLLSARRLSLARIEVRSEAARLGAELAHARAGVRAWQPELLADAAPVRSALPPVPMDTSLWLRSPRVAALEEEIRQAEALDGLAGRFWALPELTIGQQIVRDDLADLEGPVFGVRWGLPIFDRRQGERIESRGRLSAARARLELERARVREEFTAALAAYTMLRESAAGALDAENAAEGVLTSATAMFEAGESGVTDLLESLRGALSGRLAGLDAYGAALRAHRELEIAAGQPLPLTEGEE